MTNLLSQHCIVFRSNHVGDEWFEQVITQLVLSHSLAKELFCANCLCCFQHISWLSQVGKLVAKWKNFVFDAIKELFATLLVRGERIFVANSCGDLEIMLCYKWRRVTTIRHWNASHPAQPLRAMSNTLQTWQTRGDYHRCEILWCPLICIAHNVEIDNRW